MMVQKPAQWIESMADAGVDQYTFHIEPLHDDDEIESTCNKIKEAGMKVGLALKPNTELKIINRFIELADTVLIMTVEPGFGGQKFMENQMIKVQTLREEYPNLNIEVDGGVNLNTIAHCSRVSLMKSGNENINIIQSFILIGRCQYDCSGYRCYWSQ